MLKTLNANASPAKLDFHGALAKLQANAAAIKQNLATEQRNAEPFKPRYYFFWERQYHWVVIARHRDGSLTDSNHTGSYWQAISQAPWTVNDCFVFKDNGMFHMAYSRVYSYFKKEEDFSILQFNESERKEIWNLLGCGMKQWAA